MRLFEKIFGKKGRKEPSEIGLALNHADIELIKAFSRLTIDQRMMRIIAWAETGDISYFRLIQYCIVYDPEMEVRLAALKRIYHYKKHDKLRPFLKSIQGSKLESQLEPDFSIALNSVGLK